MDSAESKRPVRMIASDIDGTMLRSDGSLSDAVQAALQRAHQSGIHVVPATGRPLDVAHDVIDQLGLSQYWVFANGAITKHLERNEVVRAFWMDPSVAQGLVVELRDRLPGCRFALELEDGVAHEHGFSDLVPNKPPVPSVDDVLEHVSSRVQKVVAFHPHMSLDDLYHQANEALNGDGVASYSGLNFIEVSARLVTKAMALDWLCSDLGIDPSEVAAFGDNHNDVAMLEWAGRGYAMANATDDAKAVANAVIGANDDDALADCVHQLVDEALAART